MRRGDAAAAVDAALARDAALFVCYPPPDADAFLGEAAARFHAGGGETLALVGEWRGDTATGADLATLASLFHLAKRVALPNWGDTSAELTIWRRAAPPVPVPLPDACFTSGAAWTPGHRRCRLTCDLVFASRACANAEPALARRAALLLYKFAVLDEEDDDFDDPDRFSALPALDDASAPKRRKKKRKKDKRK